MKTALAVLALFALATVAVVVGLPDVAWVVAALAALLGGGRLGCWAVLPLRELPKNRVRHQRIRLYLRLHAGPGFGTWWELHRHWSRRACYKRVRRIRKATP